MPKVAASQKHKAITLLQKRGMARLSEFVASGITAATVSRMERAGAITRLSRGLYQLPDAPLDTHHTLAEASKLVPKGVVCLVSAMAFHGLTDSVPPKVWMAIGQKDWKPTGAYPPLRITRFPERELTAGVEVHRIEGIPARIFGVAKTLSDVFRYRRIVGVNLGIEGLRAALKHRNVKPAAIARQAVNAGVWRAMQPYLEALTFDG